MYEILLTCPCDKIIKMFCSKWYPVSGHEVNKLGRRMGSYNTRRSTTRRKAMMKAVNPSHQRTNTFRMSWHPYRSFRQMQMLLAPRRETTKAHSHTTDPVVACCGHAKHARRRQLQWTAEKQLRWEKGEDYARYILSFTDENNRDLDICALLGYYAACGGNSLPTFRDNLSGQIGCPETSVRNYHPTLRNILEELRSHLLREGSLNLRIAMTFTAWWVCCSSGLIFGRKHVTSLKNISLTAKCTFFKQLQFSLTCF